MGHPLLSFRSGQPVALVLFGVILADLKAMNAAFPVPLRHEDAALPRKQGPTVFIIQIETGNALQHTILLQKLCGKLACSHSRDAPVLEPVDLFIAQTALPQVLPVGAGQGEHPDQCGEGLMYLFRRRLIAAFHCGNRIPDNHAAGRRSGPAGNRPAHKLRHLPVSLFGVQHARTPFHVEVQLAAHPPAAMAAEPVAGQIHLHVAVVIRAVILPQTKRAVKDQGSSFFLFDRQLQSVEHIADAEGHGILIGRSHPDSPHNRPSGP